MASTPRAATNDLPGKPPVVALATREAARQDLVAREKAHTREGDAIAAARRRLPMVKIDGTVKVTGEVGPVPFLDLCQERDELLVYQHMWYDGAPHQGQCEGCTTTAWHVKDAVYRNARGVSFAILTSGLWDEVAPCLEFMGYTEPWYSERDVEAPIGGDIGHIACFLQEGDRVFQTYSTTGRGNEPVTGSLGLLDNDALWSPVRDGRTTPRAGPRSLRPARRSVGMARRSAGTGARMPTASPPGARPAGPFHNEPAPARPLWTPSAARATTTDVGHG
jgi:predicted dithiol-disulfide oxidoreductase (DUF899 family)